MYIYTYRFRFENVAFFYIYRKLKLNPFSAIFGFFISYHCRRFRPSQNAFIAGTVSFRLLPRGRDLSDARYRLLAIHVERFTYLFRVSTSIAVGAGGVQQPLQIFVDVAATSQRRRRRRRHRGRSGHTRPGRRFGERRGRRDPSGCRGVVTRTRDGGRRPRRRTPAIVRQFVTTADRRRPHRPEYGRAAARPLQRAELDRRNRPRQARRRRHRIGSTQQRHVSAVRRPVDQRARRRLLLRGRTYCGRLRGILRDEHALGYDCGRGRTNHNTHTRTQKTKKNKNQNKTKKPAGAIKRNVRALLSCGRLGAFPSGYEPPVIY